MEGRRTQFLQIPMLSSPCTVPTFSACARVTVDEWWWVPGKAKLCTCTLDSISSWLIKGTTPSVIAFIYCIFWVSLFLSFNKQANVIISTVFKNTDKLKASFDPNSPTSLHPTSYLLFITLLLKRIFYTHFLCLFFFSFPLYLLHPGFCLH